MPRTPYPAIARDTVTSLIPAYSANVRLSQPRTAACRRGSDASIITPVSPRRYGQRQTVHVDEVRDVGTSIRQSDTDLGDCRRRYCPVVKRGRHRPRADPGQTRDVGRLEPTADHLQLQPGCRSPRQLRATVGMRLGRLILVRIGRGGAISSVVGRSLPAAFLETEPTLPFTLGMERLELAPCGAGGYGLVERNDRAPPHCRSRCPPGGWLRTSLPLYLQSRVAMPRD